MIRELDFSKITLHIEGCYDRRRFGGRVVRVRHDSKWLFEDVVEEGSEAEVVGENIYT